MRIVPALDEIEDRQASIDPVTENTPIDEFTLQGGKERFAERIVVGVSD